MLSALGPALFFSACVVRYRDVATIVGFGLQLFLFVSPVAYPPDLVPDRWETLQYVNPLAGALALYRSALGGSDLPAIGLVLLSALSATVIAVLALIYFRMREQEFVDII
jgi:lipopolysaccharide transport system permease protein